MKTSLIAKMTHVRRASSCVCAVALLAVTLQASAADVSSQPTAMPAPLMGLIQAAIAQNPIVKGAQANMRAAEQDVSVAERAAWPTLSVVNEKNLNDAGRSARVTTLQVDHTLWDNGVNDARVAGVKAQAATAALQTRLQQQDLAIQVINAWQALLAAQMREQAAQDTEAAIEAYKAQMVRRVNALASPAIDLELVNARLLQTQVERVSAKNSVAVALRALTRLTGQENLADQAWAKAATAMPPATPEQIAAFRAQLANFDWAAMTASHDLVEKARLEYAQVAAELDAKQSERWPQAYARLDQPLNNNAVTGSNQANYFIGIRYTPGAGLTNGLESQALTARLEAQTYQIETAGREISQLVFDDRQAFATNIDQAQTQDRSLKGAQMVLVSYERQFQAGRKTWQDLLNAAREVAQNRFSLSDTQAALQGAMHRLQIRMGAVDGLLDARVVHGAQ
jgi:outer membrane protein, adhesin transport system